MIAERRRLLASPAETSRGLAALLFLVFFAPALAIAWGSENGEIVFVLYREPKLACWKILGWVFLAVLFWRRRLTGPRVVATLRHPVVATLGLFLLWAAVTAAWVTVRRNLTYELGQYLLLFFLLVCLRAHPEAEQRWHGTVGNALIAGLAALTGVGIVQASGGLPWLLPIDPQFGGHHPSLMGYKNPMALALAGQIFLVAGRAAGKSRRWPWLLLLAVEVGYLASLLSRTSYLALGAGGSVLGVLGWMRRRARGGRRSGVIPAVAILVAAVGILAVSHPGTRARLESAASLLTSPSRYLETDRGVYLKNTLHMVRHRPWGVGLGDWQTHYPVYRKHDRYRSFDDRFQVRRAHSDHVQTLGETGWLGFALWTVFWITALGHACRRALAPGTPRFAVFLAAQLAAFGVAMATDYVIEIPYLKLEFFAVLFLSLGPPRGFSSAAEHGAPAVGAADASEQDRNPRWASRLLVAPVALAVAVTSCLAVAKSHYAVALTHHYLSALDAEGAEGARRLVSASREGAIFARLPGHEKNLFRAWLVLADTWLRLGRPEAARVAAEQALKLHPFNPGTYRLLAKLERHLGRTAEAARWETLYREIMDETDSGPPTGSGSV